MTVRGASPAGFTAALLIAAGLARPGLAVAQGAPIKRDGLAAVEAALDRAVGQVSRPAPGIVLGRAESARGYHLPGYGVVFVLTPRALPRGGGVRFLRPRPSPKGGPRPLFETRVEREGARDETAAPRPENAQGPLRAEEARPRGRHGQGLPLADGENPEGDQLLAIEQQVLDFQRAAEEERQSAEREFERLTRDFRRLMGPFGAPRAAGAPAMPPAPGAAPVVAEPPSPALPLPPRGEGPPPLSPPWRYWFETDGLPEDRPPDRIVADVRGAAIATLESEGPRLRGLAADAFVAVAIDFHPVGAFVSEARPARTVVIRARKQDLDLRRGGKLSAEELRRRVEVTEY